MQPTGASFQLDCGWGNIASYVSSSQVRYDVIGYENRTVLAVSTFVERRAAEKERHMRSWAAVAADEAIRKARQGAPRRDGGRLHLCLSMYIRGHRSVRARRKQTQLVSGNRSSHGHCVGLSDRDIHLPDGSRDCRSSKNCWSCDQPSVCRLSVFEAFIVAMASQAAVL